MAVAASHPVIVRTVSGADMVLRFGYTNPDAWITLHLGDPELGDGLCLSLQSADNLPIEQHKTPHATLIQEADFAHRFWCGLESPGRAIVEGHVKASGNYLRALALYPLITPIFKVYVQTLHDLGLDHLIPDEKVDLIASDQSMEAS
ncbi:MAG: hypothetical protein H6684_12040 [Deltaproteobacteria bacterium]|nr:hypothetical protein [bacterium]MCB9476529.1 hypothetical protein [Deltaproteobacteria bacterium]MCB9489455.1 hypothetical protein [Deltaproteobacteria bacterium]